jgi:ketosteroid isomerase-like protein
MLLSPSDVSALDRVRALERRRIEATRANDAEALAPLLDDELVYINSVGALYDKQGYLRAISSHGLTYDRDFDVQEQECRTFDDLVILVGIMLGHSRLDGEQQVFRFRCLGVWRRDGAEWRMVAWQSSSCSTALGQMLRIA